MRLWLCSPGLHFLCCGFAALGIQSAVAGQRERLGWKGATAVRIFDNGHHAQQQVFWHPQKFVMATNWVLPEHTEARQVRNTARTNVNRNVNRNREVRIVAVPNDFVLPRPGTFEPATRNALVDLGEKMGQDASSRLTASL